VRRTLLILLASLPACHAPAPHVYTFTHAAGKPCPGDYTLVHAFFTERDGSHEDACAAPRGAATEYTFDELKAGESATLELPAPKRLIPAEVIQ
jgi:hypothetical protein